MKVFLDASLLIYLNTMEKEEEGNVASSRDRELLEKFYLELLKEDLYTNTLILDETLYLSMSKYRVPYSLTFEFIKTNVLPFSTIIPVEELDVGLMEKYLGKYKKLKPSDAIHLSTMEKVGVRNIASEDSDFDLVGEVKRIWLSSSLERGKSS